MTLESDFRIWRLACTYTIPPNRHLLRFLKIDRWKTAFEIGHQKTKYSSTKEIDPRLETAVFKKYLRS
jgi:hypothetical protein